jgi:hypothetical protein
MRREYVHDVARNQINEAAADAAGDIQPVSGMSPANVLSK